MELVLVAAICLLVFAGVTAFFNRGVGPAVEAEELLRRLRPSIPDEVELTRKGRGEESWLARVLLRRINLLRKLERYTWQAGLYWRVSEILLAELVLLLGGFVAGWMMWADPLLASGCAGALSAIPILYVMVGRNRRLKTFARQLPYALDMMKSTVEAGHSLQRAFHAVVGEFTDPIAGELRTVLEQTRLGVPLVRALDDMLDRVPVDDLRLMITAIKMQTEVGSSLAHIVGRLSEVIRTRQRLAAQIRAITAQARMSGTVVGLLPVGLVGIFSVIHPDFVHMLFTDPAGINLLKGAIVLDTVAVVVIRKIIKVRY